MAGPGDAIRADLVRLFKAEGYGDAVLTISRTVPGTYDPATGGTGSPSTLSKTGMGRVGTYSDSVIVKSGLIESNDRKVTWIPDDLTFVPEVADVLTHVATGKTYNVINFKTRELNGSLICYTLQVRNG